MWNIFDQWIVLLALFWAVWVLFRILTKKSFLSCNSPCDKKIFKRSENALVTLRRK